MKLTYSLLILSFLLSAFNQALSQVSQRSGDIFEEVSNIIADMPGDSGDDYDEPSNEQLEAWEDILNQLILGEYALADETADLIGYDLVEFTDTTNIESSTFFMLEAVGDNYWGTYIYNPNHCRPLVIQSPHAKRDANTGLQGIHCFRKTNAIFYQVNGTHRCNSSAYSSCTGTTSSCSSDSEAYRISDLAHTSQSIFQKTTEVLLNAFEDSHFIQLHGFTKQETDPYVILSNGTQVAPTPDFMSLLSEKLFEEDPILTFRVAHIDTDWTRLRGFWNTQGRLINQQPDPCDADATNSEGRFFHVEQERTRLRSNLEGWDKMANALSNTFECVSTANEGISQTKQITIYPNPTSHTLHIEGEGLGQINTEHLIYNLYGQNMGMRVKLSMTQANSIDLDLSSLSEGIYFVAINGTVNRIYKL